MHMNHSISDAKNRIRAMSHEKYRICGCIRVYINTCPKTYQCLLYAMERTVPAVSYGKDRTCGYIYVHASPQKTSDCEHAGGEYGGVV